MKNSTEQTTETEGIDCDSPVTIIVKRWPKPDRIADFEEVMSGTTKDAMAFTGHLGANIIKPTKTGDRYRIVFKFDSMRNYLAWENSSVREKWLERYAERGNSRRTRAGNTQRLRDVVYLTRWRSIGTTTKV